MSMELPDQQAAAAHAQSVVEQAQTPIPDAPEVVDNLVKLPGGFIRGSDLTTTATVRELNGKHEERLARAQRSGNQLHFFDVMLECGTERIGSYPESDTKTLLKELLVGDREELLLGIRNVTYGPEISVSNWPCPSCKRKMDLKLDITDDITRRTLKDRRGDRTFEVPLSKGRKASCTLLTGHDQEVVMSDEEYTTAERGTVILTRCVQEIVDSKGVSQTMAGWPSLALEMSIPDRHKILAELDKRSPGPRYNAIELKHEECGEEVTLALAIGDLFLV